MRLPFFRSKNPADSRAQPAKGPMGGPTGGQTGGQTGGLADEPSVQAARTRARRRLIGALVLLAAGVVGFPILFETQPRPLPVDTPILLPDGAAGRVAPPSQPAAARPLPAVPPDAGNEPVVAAAPPPPPSPAASSPAPAPLPSPAPAVSKPTSPAAALTPAPPAPRPQPAKVETPRPEPAKPTPPAAEPAKPAAEAAAAGRFVVQVGAYNDPERLRTARQKVEKLGYKTYTQDVESPTGKRTRVRVGPFASRQEADAVAVKLKSSGMQANILAL